MLPDSMECMAFGVGREDRRAVCLEVVSGSVSCVVSARSRI